LKRAEGADGQMARKDLDEALKFSSTSDSQEIRLLTTGYLLLLDAKQGKLKKEDGGFKKFVKEVDAFQFVDDTKKTETYLIATQIANFLKEPNRALIDAKIVEQIARSKGFKAELLKAHCLMARAYYDKNQPAEGKASLLAAQSVAAQIRSELPQLYMASFSVHPDYEPECLASK
jgi:hypothetical protein